MSNKPEPAPVPNSSVPIWELVIADMKERNEIGTKKYGTPLQAFNGRDALVDLTQELMDALVYCKQMMVERDSKSDDSPKGFTFNEYQEQAHKTAIYPTKDTLAYLTMGLVGEAGEIVNKVKKVLRDKGGVLNTATAYDIASEVGDCLWYCAELCRFLGWPLEEVAKANLSKLNTRKQEGTLQGDGDNR